MGDVITLERDDVAACNRCGQMLWYVGLCQIDSDYFEIRSLECANCGVFSYPNSSGALAKTDPSTND